MSKYDRFFDGYELEAYNLFGAHKVNDGVEFTVWAPNAYKVEVFMSKDDFKVFYPLDRIDFRGVWQTVVLNCDLIYSYRYRIYKDPFTYHDKSDPFAFLSELRPGNASVMYDLDSYQFSDDDFLKNRHFSYDDPMNIYEVHLNGFKKERDLATYKEAKEHLIPYLKEMGFTHLELMPVTEHPFDGSWGYQSSGFFSATSRYGSPYDLMDFINECHKNGIHVIMDAVYTHFVADAFSLCNFDFTPLYEYSEEHLRRSEWGTYYFNLLSRPVISFLLSSANFFLEVYHFDGLRLDAVSHFIHHKGNKFLGENKAGHDFIKRFNFHIKKAHPDCVIIAEDSSDFPKVTVPVEFGGLGFDYKWDLGWMNDTFKYLKMDPVYRKYHHNAINFSMYYFFNEKYLLPLSHDEVVHSKGTVIDKMYGSYEDKFKQVRTLYMYMFTHPGKKLNFMGNELALFREFDEKKEMDWFMLKYPLHDSFKEYFKALNHMYLDNPAFYQGEYDANSGNFRWIDADNANWSLFTYYRSDGKNIFVTVLNMTPNRYDNLEIGVPDEGEYVEYLNSDNTIYSGDGYVNEKPLVSFKKATNNLEDTIAFRLGSFASITFKHVLKKKRARKTTVKALAKKEISAEQGA